MTKNEQMDKIFNTVGLSYLSNLYEEAKQNIEEMDEATVNEYAEKINLEELIKVTFNKSKKIIESMTLKRRIKMLSELDEHLLYLYQETKGYNDALFGKARYGPKEFQKIMGKIKHLEILQNWLYGID
jgi:hypothetical protein